jgi:hypothetical protein
VPSTAASEFAEQYAHNARDGAMNRSDYVYREYPKLLTTPRGPVIVRSIAEERALIETPSVEPDTAEAPRPVSLTSPIGARLRKLLRIRRRQDKGLA